MFGKKLPIGLLVVVLVITLAGLGAGYALWNEWLEIRGTIFTGGVDVELSLVPPEDNEIDKDVGICTAMLGPDNNSLDILIENGYPSYECWVTFDVHSVGSIPVHIYQPEFTSGWPPDPSAVFIELQNCYPNDRQLHQSERAYCTIYMHVLQDADQGAMYDFLAHVEARQFNEPRVQK
jgi:hypothetical protein